MIYFANELVIKWKSRSFHPSEVLAESVPLFDIANGLAQSSTFPDELPAGLPLGVVGVVVGSDQSASVDHGGERAFSVGFGYFLIADWATLLKVAELTIFEVGCCCLCVIML